MNKEIKEQIEKVKELSKKYFYPLLALKLVKILVIYYIFK